MNTEATLFVPKGYPVDQIPSQAEIDAAMDFFKNQSLTNRFTFTAPELLTVDGTKLTDFTAVVVARFTKDEDIHFILATGDVVNISESLRF